MGEDAEADAAEETEMQEAQAQAESGHADELLTQELLSRIRELEQSVCLPRGEQKASGAGALCTNSSLAHSLLRGCMWVLLAVVVPALAVAVGAVAVKMASSRRYISHLA